MEIVVDDKSLKAGETIVILLLEANYGLRGEPLPNEIFRYIQPKNTRWRKKIKRIELSRR